MTAVKINGVTRLYAIVGDPIAQVRSPEVYTELFATAGMNAVMVPAHVRTEDFDTVLPALMRLGNLDGLLVTVPFKSRVVPLTDRLGPAATLIGAVNALRREADGSWTGDIFDGMGFVRGVERKGDALPGRHVFMFGAGGAGSAIACALAGAGVRSIAMLDPIPGRAEAVATVLRKAFPACDLAAVTTKPDGVNMVVNASPVGMRPDDGMPGDTGTLSPDTLVGDVVLTDSSTPFIQHAIRHGCRYVTGRDMLHGQIDALMAFFAPTLSPSVGAQSAR